LGKGNRVKKFPAVNRTNTDRQKPRA